MVKYDKKGRKTTPQLKDYALNFRVEGARRKARNAKTGSRFKPPAERKWALKVFNLNFRGRGLENKTFSANLDKINAWKKYRGRK